MIVDRNEVLPIGADEAAHRLNFALTMRGFRPSKSAYEPIGGAYSRGSYGASIYTVSVFSLHREFVYLLVPEANGGCALKAFLHIQTFGQAITASDRAVISGELDDIIAYVRDLSDNRESRLDEYEQRTKATTKFAIFTATTVILIAFAVAQFNPWWALVASGVALCICILSWKGLDNAYAKSREPTRD